MVERICPACTHGNPVSDRYCGKCGAPLERLLPVKRAANQLTVAGRDLPVTWTHVGRTVALGVAAIAAEAGLAWLRRKIDTSPPSATTALARVIPPQAPSATGRPSSIVTIVSQRVVEILDTADGRKISERTFWRRIDE